MVGVNSDGDSYGRLRVGTVNLRQGKFRDSSRFFVLLFLRPFGDRFTGIGPATPSPTCLHYTPQTLACLHLLCDRTARFLFRVETETMLAFERSWHCWDVITNSSPTRSVSLLPLIKTVPER